MGGGGGGGGGGWRGKRREKLHLLSRIFDDRTVGARGEGGMGVERKKERERGVGDLIETKVYVLAFIGEISKTLGLLPIDITMGSKTSLSSFFMINYIAKYNALLCFVRKRLDSYQLVCSILHSPIFTVWKGDESRSGMGKQTTFHYNFRFCGG